MNIILTGGAGYVGCAVVEELAKKYLNSKIVVYDNFSKGKLEAVGEVAKNFSNIEILPWEGGDIRDIQNFEKALEEFKPEIVVNLAAIVDAFTTNREGKDRECEIVNFESAVKLAKLSKEKGVKKFIQQSTVSIYSRGEDLKEDAVKEPLSMYGKAKIRAEEDILKLNSKDFQTCCLRPATIVGYTPGFRYETIINLICIRSLYKIMINIFESALDNNKSYLYVRDNAKAIIFAIENMEKLAGESFNVVSFNTNLTRVLTEVKRLVGDFPYRIIQQKSINQQVYTINADKIRALGFAPDVTSVEFVIRETIENLRKRKR